MHQVPKNLCVVKGIVQLKANEKGNSRHRQGYKAGNGKAKGRKRQWQGNLGNQGQGSNDHEWGLPVRTWEKQWFQPAWTHDQQCVQTEPDSNQRVEEALLIAQLDGRKAWVASIAEQIERAVDCKDFRSAAELHELQLEGEAEERQLEGQLHNACGSHRDHENSRSSSFHKEEPLSESPSPVRDSGRKRRR